MVVSAVDKNLNANAISTKPRKTLTTLSHPPDEGIEFNHVGKIAKSIKGRARASPNPNIPIIKAVDPPYAERPPSKLPNIGPVHEKEARDKTSAIKKNGREQTCSKGGHLL